MRESGLKSISILDSVGDNVVFLHAREWIEIDSQAFAPTQH